MKLPPAHITCTGNRAGYSTDSQTTALFRFSTFQVQNFLSQFLGHFAQRQKEFKGTHCQVHNKWAGFEHLVGL